MDHATCEGLNRVYVDKGFWRDKQMREEIYECMNEDACKGGYVPDVDPPVECAEGYEGPLCSNCIANSDGESF